MVSEIPHHKIMFGRDHLCSASRQLIAAPVGAIVVGWRGGAEWRCVDVQLVRRVGALWPTGAPLFAPVAKGGQQSTQG
jgi:hypothetical protein